MDTDQDRRDNQEEPCNHNKNEDEPAAAATTTTTPSSFSSPPLRPSTTTWNSDLSSRPRDIWIVPTAALPWRTGTAINPLLRALALCQTPIGCDNDNHNANKPSYHRVTLLLPWLTQDDQRLQLYGRQHVFDQPADQEAWIRSYCRTQCQCSEDHVARLEIAFWKATYNAGFGSIFPKQDILTLIPPHRADVAILEEPEHLNWFRPLDHPQDNHPNQQTTNSSNNNGHAGAALDVAKEQPTKEEEEEEKAQQDAPVSATTTTTTTEQQATTVEERRLWGWAFYFRHVVGILHTNYAAYLSQYGGAFVTATALNALSALTLKSYCHVVIKLSSTLPSLVAQPPNGNNNNNNNNSTGSTGGDPSAEPKGHESIQQDTPVVEPTKPTTIPTTTTEESPPFVELTCNVHGVRNEFLEPVVEPETEDSPQDNQDMSGEGTIPLKDETDTTTSAQVYFIGKVIWAKGFDKVLQIQEQYKALTGAYFPMDIYGNGNDMQAIQLAFWGRRGGPQQGSSSSLSNKATRLARSNSSASSTEKNDAAAAEVLQTTESIRQQVVQQQQQPEDGGASTAKSSLASGTTPSDVGSDTEEGTRAVSPSQDASSPLLPQPPVDVLGDLTEQVVQSGVVTAEASMQLMESVFCCQSDEKQSQQVQAPLSPNQQQAQGEPGNMDDSQGRSGSGGGGGWGGGLFGGWFGNHNRQRAQNKDDGKPVQDEELDTDETATRKIASAASPPSSRPQSPTSGLLSNTLSPRKAAAAAAAAAAAPFQFLPARSRFKWRKHAIPARFLGVKDHAELRGTRNQPQIFLNMSTTEVLCTTSAEALAMGKFVILPKHASNEFFFQFPNCLTYETSQECVQQLVYALEHDPEPLSPIHHQALTWQGATERLYQASSISIDQQEELDRRNARAQQLAAARHHVSLMRKSNFVSNLFSSSKAAVTNFPLLKKTFSSSASLSSLGRDGATATEKITQDDKHSEKSQQDST